MTKKSTIQHNRSTSTGVAPTTSDIAVGEIGINLVDGRAFTSNGTSTFDLVSNVSTSFSITGNYSFRVGNSTVNAVANSSTFKISNSTVNTFITLPNTVQYAATNYFLHANGSWVQAGIGNNKAFAIALIFGR